MEQKRKKAIDKLISETKKDTQNIALILVGSSATGEVHESSDIDLYLVVTKQTFKAKEKDKNFFFGTWDPTKYYGLEIDGKIIDIDYLKEAIHHANDATRYSFTNAKIFLFSQDTSIKALLPRISKYPESTHLQRIKQLYAYVKHYRYIGEDAFNRNNTFHAHHCIIQLIYFSSRLILTHNKKLFPCHKRLLLEVNKCDKKPIHFVNKSNDLLQNINKKAMIEYFEYVIHFFAEYEYPDVECIGYILEDEWAWKTGRLPISEL
jgi:predicted nucleotidyltransferase